MEGGMDGVVSRRKKKKFYISYPFVTHDSIFTITHKNRITFKCMACLCISTLEV